MFLEAHNAVKPQLSKPVFLKTFLNTSSFWRLIRKYSGLVCSTYICILIQACLVRIINPTTFLLKICQDEKSGLLKLYTHSKIRLDLIFLDTFTFLGQKCNFLFIYSSKTEYLHWKQICLLTLVDKMVYIIKLFGYKQCILLLVLYCFYCTDQALIK